MPHAPGRSLRQAAELRERVLASGYEPARRNTPEEFGKFIAADTAKWIDLAARINLKGQ